MHIFVIGIILDLRMCMTLFCLFISHKPKLLAMQSDNFVNCTIIRGNNNNNKSLYTAIILLFWRYRPKSFLLQCIAHKLHCNDSTISAFVIILFKLTEATQSIRIMPIFYSYHSLLYSSNINNNNDGIIIVWPFNYRADFLLIS